jgi:tetratricopeptide (TPR) repeat protein/predicted Ser/Thr protein kinase
MIDARGDVCALDILEQRLDLAEAEREAALDLACEGNDVLRSRVAALLAADARTETPLDRSADDLLGLLVDEGPGRTVAVGERIGPYRLLGELGRGGMGVVYLAERDDAEFTRLVALKVIRPGPDADLLVRRFLRERQILADLRHPAIAQLYDGGRTDAGLPYLAMEYVEGQPIDRWCRDHHLTIEQRLRLFCLVCDAVQHAHQKLVVHRDLKPAHVLVTGSGDVKLLDFGIARLLDDGAADPTRTALHAFTPRYASPEQLRRESVGAATDVYALGVILYELLTGRPPFEDQSDPYEAARAVLESDPPPPSRTAAAESGRALRGDLDAIVLSALRRDPARRYATAASLRDDIVRFLTHEPVRARPETFRYRTAKFLRRRRAAVSAAALVVLLTATFATLHGVRITGERNRAELEARKAGEVRDFLVALFNVNLPNESLGDTLSVRDLLERGVVRADSLVDQPELRALLLTTLGDVYRVLARYDRAESLINGAVAIYDSLPDVPAVDRAGALVSLSNLYWDLGRYDDAVEPARRALELQRSELSDEHADVLRSMRNLATLESHVGNHENALRLQEDLLARRRRALGPDDPAIVVTLSNIGVLHYRQERYEPAERLFREGLALGRRVLAPTHPDVMLLMNNLASVLREQDRFDEAEPLLREALDLRIQVYGPDHPRVAVSHYNLGRLLHARGRIDEGITHLRTTLDIDRRAYGPLHPEIGVDAFQLGSALVDAGQCPDALVALAEADAVFRTHADSAGIARTDEARQLCSQG